jgi:hypothetical protein
MDHTILKQDALPSNLKSKIAMNSILLLCMFSSTMSAEVPCETCDSYHHINTQPSVKYDIEAYEKKKTYEYAKSHKAFSIKKKLSSSNIHENSYKNHTSKENMDKQIDTKKSNLKQVLENLEDYDA